MSQPMMSVVIMLKAPVWPQPLETRSLGLSVRWPHSQPRSLRCPSSTTLTHPLAMSEPSRRQTGGRLSARLLDPCAALDEVVLRTLGLRLRESDDQDHARGQAAAEGDNLHIAEKFRMAFDSRRERCAEEIQSPWSGGTPATAGVYPLGCVWTHSPVTLHKKRKRA